VVLLYVLLFDLLVLFVMMAIQHPKFHKLFDIVQLAVIFYDDYVEEIYHYHHIIDLQEFVVDQFLFVQLYPDECLALKVNIELQHFVLIFVEVV